MTKMENHHVSDLALERYKRAQIEQPPCDFVTQCGFEEHIFENCHEDIGMMKEAIRKSFETSDTIALMDPKDKTLWETRNKAVEMIATDNDYLGGMHGMADICLKMILIAGYANVDLFGLANNTPCGELCLSVYLSRFIRK